MSKNTTPTTVIFPEQYENTRLWKNMYLFRKELDSSWEDLPGDEDDEFDLENCTEEEQEEITALIKGISAATPFDEENIACGQVRMLSPEFTSENEIIRHVVIYHVWEEADEEGGLEALYLVAPVSLDRFPAVQGEMLFRVGEEKEPQAIETWNTVIVPESALGKSWYAGEWSEEDCQDLWEHFSWLTVGGELPEALRKRTGAPFFRDTDPQASYQEEEGEAFKGFRDLIDEIMGKEESEG